MTPKKTCLFVFFSMIAFISCKKLLIKPDPTSDAERNFEIFWNDLHNGYPYFVEDNIDWKGRYNTFRKSVTSSTTTDQLYNTMTQMLSGFSDGHLSVSYNGKYYSNEKTLPNLLQLVRADQSGTALTSTSPVRYYLDHYLAINKGYISNTTYQVATAPNYINPNKKDTICIFGKITGQNIVYVNITTFLTNASIEDVLHSIITTYPSESTNGMILDLRMNEGGNLGLMWDAISVFLPSGTGQITYAYNREKVGPLPENFGAETQFVVSENNKLPKYTNKAIIVLTNRVTVSAAEHATMAMRQAKTYNQKIKIIGDYTFGATSFIVERTLPCGIEYTLVNNKTWDIHHAIVERTGVKPDELVYLTANKIQADKDEQLERAIAIINGN